MIPSFTNFVTSRKSSFIMVNGSSMREVVIEASGSIKLLYIIVSY